MEIWMMLFRMKINGYLAQYGRHAEQAFFRLWWWLYFHKAGEQITPWNNDTMASCLSVVTSDFSISILHFRTGEKHHGFFQQGILSFLVTKIVYFLSLFSALVRTTKLALRNFNFLRSLKVVPNIVYSIYVLLLQFSDKICSGPSVCRIASQLIYLKKINKKSKKIEELQARKNPLQKKIWMKRGGQLYRGHARKMRQNKRQIYQPWYTTAVYIHFPVFGEQCRWEKIQTTLCMCIKTGNFHLAEKQHRAETLPLGRCDPCIIHTIRQLVVNCQESIWNKSICNKPWRELLIVQPLDPMSKSIGWSQRWNGPVRRARFF